MSTIPFSDSAIATSGSSGTITFKGFQQPRVGMWRTGSLSVVGSDGTPVTPATVLPVTWRAFVGATTWGGWYNDQPSSLVQTNGPPVKVTGTNLSASTAYQCIFTGYDSDAPPPLSPQPVPAPPPAGPQIVVSNNVALPAGAGGTQIGSDMPVVVGTNLEIFECATAAFGGGIGNSIRLRIYWSLDGSFVDPIEWDIDLALNVNMRGLILPNLAPFVRFNALSHGSTQIFLTAFTGLPTVIRSPIVPTGVLAFANPPAGGTSNTALPPYIGPASLYIQPNNTAGFGAEIDSFDWQGNLVSITRNEQGWPAGTGPFSAQGIVYLPPLINVLKIQGGAPGQVVSLTSLGP